MKRAMYTRILNACRAQKHVSQRTWGVDAGPGCVYQKIWWCSPCAIGALLIQEKALRAEVFVDRCGDAATHLGIAAPLVMAFVRGFDSYQFVGPGTRDEREYHAAGRRMAKTLTREGVLT